MSTFIQRHTNSVLIITLLLFPLILTGVWGGITYQVNPQPTGQVVVMTYNIHEAFDVNNRLDLNGILTTIQQSDPDIIVLQEVDTGVIMSGTTDQARWLAQQLNMFLAPIISADHIWQSDVILSKYPILDYEETILPSPSEDDTLLRADIEIAGQHVSVYAVHFSVFSSTDRRIQADVAIPYVTSTGSTIKIWAGDFNIDAYTTDPVDQGIYADITAFLNDSFEVALSQNGNLTWPSTAPYQRIDYVFVTSSITVLSHSVPSSLASDHLPVVTQLQLPGSPFRTAIQNQELILDIQISEEEGS
ncbi:MAG: endonuclease/exonuclease/phosphatase family protein [Candidatus Hermodarchaeota archaeon]|nr:endonuclease/exonuclease/phosphatase family protein [Candidatus Hermodarchaeota archaeon]